MGVELDQWHDDQDYSGGNVDRPGFLEVIRRIEAGATGDVIVARIDPTTDFGKAMLNIMFVMAELQLDQLKSGWKTAKGRAVGPAIVAGAIDAVFLRRPPQRRADVSERACIVRRGHAEDDLPGKGRPVAPSRPFAWPDECTAARRKVST